MNDMLFIILTLLFIPIFIIMIFIPYWTRRTESFGVSIPEKLFDTTQLKKMRKKYAIQMSIVSLITLVTFLPIYFFIHQNEKLVAIVYSLIILIYLISSFLVYLVFHREMKKLKEEQGWFKHKKQQVVIHTKFHNEKLTISNWLYMIPFMITFLLIYITILFYDKLPEHIPIQYNLNGVVRRFAEKSYGSALFAPITLFFLIIVMLIVNVVIAKSKQQVNPDHPEESIMRNVIFRKRWSIFLYVTTILFSILFSLMHASLFVEINSKLMLSLPLIITFIIIGGAIVLSITTGQGGSRINIKTKKDETVIDRDDDQYWKLGQFYFNKDDPALFLEKRFGIGWTINMARPAAWLFLIGILIIAIGLPILLSL